MRKLAKRVEVSNLVRRSFISGQELRLHTKNILNRPFQIPDLRSLHRTRLWRIGGGGEMYCSAVVPESTASRENYLILGI